jgi:4-hydroxyacetophenone monooxygenase
LVPRVAEQAAQLSVLQRSPQWVRPSPDYHRTVGAGTRWLLHHLPFYAAWYRFGLFWRFGDGLHRSLQIDPQWTHPERSLNRTNERHRVEITKYIEEQLDHDAELIAKCMPDYPPFGKRILVDNGWFKTLRRDNVDLVTEEIEKITADGIAMQNGDFIPADVIVLATGFHASGMLGDMDVQGRDGKTLAQHWGKDDPRAYMGMTTPGFPNLFFLYGPNTNLGHGGSIIFQSECQVRYVTACIVKILAQGAAQLECLPEVHDAYNAKVDAAHEKMIWTHRGMSTYYRNSAGRVVTNSPWRMVDYWWMTREPDFNDYAVK